MRKFFKTVAIVTIFSLSEKFLGFIYRIYMSHSIGSEGVGLYQVSLSMFAFLFTLISSGVPITVSRLMTKYKALNDKKRVDKIVTAGLLISLIFSIPVCLLVFIFSGKLNFLFADTRCIRIFLIIMPGLIFTSVYSVMRGIFWGNKDFLPYSIIELLEEICMIVVGIILINNSVNVEMGTVSAGIAVLVSYIFSFSLSIAVFIFRKNKLANPIEQLVPLLKSSTPITIMRTVSSLSMSAVSIILPMRLVLCGYSQPEALSLFGAAVGQAVPLMFAPTSLISSFTLVLIPEISENYYKENLTTLRKDIEKSVSFSVLLSCLFIPIFFVCGKEIGVIIFNSYECGKFLSVSSILVVFIGLNNITTSILNSLGKENNVLFFCMLSGLFMILSVLFLPKFLGIYSVFVGYLFIFGLTSLLNLLLIRSKMKVKPKVFRPLLFSIILTIPTIILGLMLFTLVISVFGNVLSVIFCSVVMCLFYLLLAVGFKLIDINMIKLPKKKVSVKNKIVSKTH